MAQDYYEILGVNRSASAEEIKRAFRQKAHQHHPDKTGGDAEAFKKVNEAYQVLSHPEKRQQYDQFGATYDQARRQGGAGFGGFEGFNQQQWSQANVDFGDIGDIFGDLFGFGGGRPRRPTKSRGQDIEAEVRVPFRTAAFGGTEHFEINHQVNCDQCDGSGAEAGSKPVTCTTCRGSGQVQRTQQTFLGAFQSVGVCPTCQGAGQMIKDRCRHCRGEGRRRQKEELSVKIPAGIDTGQRIRLAGQGEAGLRGQPAGDLYLRITVQPDREFTRAGSDIMNTAPIPLTVAALGGTVSVKTLTGTAHLKIPAGTPSGRVFLLRGRGLPHIRGNGQGDQRVTVELVIPEKLSVKQKKLLQELQAEGL